MVQLPNQSKGSFKKNTIGLDTKSSSQESNSAKTNQDTSKRSASKHQSMELELLTWRKQWSEYMRRCHMYLDSFDHESSERVRPTLLKVGCSLDLHFSAVTTILVTKRTIDSNYPPSDVISKAKVRDIKIWSYEKLLRFLTNLCGSLVVTSLNAESTSSASNTMNTTTNTTATNNNTRSTTSRESLHQTSTLRNLLKEEQLYGSTDIDVKREDFYKFQGPYQLVWDPTHRYKPLHSVEFDTPKTNNEAEWPQLTPTGNGRSPFCAAEKGRSIPTATVKLGINKPTTTIVNNLNNESLATKGANTKKRKNTPIASVASKRSKLEASNSKTTILASDNNQRNVEAKSNVGLTSGNLVTPNTKNSAYNNDSGKSPLDTIMQSPSDAQHNPVGKGVSAYLGPKSVDSLATLKHSPLQDNVNFDNTPLSNFSVHASGIGDYESKSTATLASGLSGTNSAFSNLNSQPPGYGSGSVGSYGTASNLNADPSYLQMNMFSMKRRGKFSTPNSNNKIGLTTNNNTGSRNTTGASPFTSTPASQITKDSHINQASSVNPDALGPGTSGFSTLDPRTSAISSLNKKPQNTTPSNTNWASSNWMRMISRQNTNTVGNKIHDSEEDEEGQGDEDSEVYSETPSRSRINAPNNFKTKLSALSKLGALNGMEDNIIKNTSVKQGLDENDMKGRTDVKENDIYDHDHDEDMGDATINKVEKLNATPQTPQSKEPSKFVQPSTRAGVSRQQNSVLQQQFIAHDQKQAISHYNNATTTPLNKLASRNQSTNLKNVRMRLYSNYVPSGAHETSKPNSTNSHVKGKNSSASHSGANLATEKNPHRKDPSLVPNHGIRRNGQAGHCENCHDYYQDFFDHIASEKHRMIARDNTHWSQVDGLLKVLDRPIKKPH